MQVNETWALLDPVLGVQRRGLAHVLDTEFISRWVFLRCSRNTSSKPYFSSSVDRIIGMFEQNNVGVRLENPVAAYCRTLRPHSPEVPAFLRNLQLIVGNLESKPLPTSNLPLNLLTYIAYLVPYRLLPR